MNNKFVKIIGIAASAIGIIATIVTNWVNEKTLDNKINEKVMDILSKQ